MIFLDIPHILVIYIVMYTVIYTVIPDTERFSDIYSDMVGGIICATYQQHIFFILQEMLGVTTKLELLLNFDTGRNQKTWRLWRYKL